MKKIKLIIPFLLIAILFSFKCRKNEVLPQLPAETQTGANTFGCKINDTIYLPTGTPFTCPAYNVQYYKSDGALLIKTSSTCASGLNVYLYNVSQAKDYEIFNPIANAYYYRNSRNSNSNCNLYERLNSVQTGTVTITRLDLINKIVSGKFNGILKIAGCPDIVITEGRFDFKMDVYN